MASKAKSNKFYPHSGRYFHREHRSRKGRKYDPDRKWTAEKKKKLEKIKRKDNEGPYYYNQISLQRR